MTEGNDSMRGDRLDLIRCSGNVGRDLGCTDADVKQCRAILAAGIVKTLDKEVLSVQVATTALE